MSASVSKPDVRSQLNHLRAGSANVRIAANSLDGTEFLPLVRQAMGETDLSQKAMAINAGQSESVISEALNARRHFAVAWLWVQPDTFVIRFLTLWMDAKELTPANIRAVQRKRIVELIDLLLEACA